MIEVIQGLSNLLNNSKYRNGQSEFAIEIREKAKHLRPHFENKYPEFLLQYQHPGEELWMKQHRANNWQSPTIAATGRVQTSCQKIQQSDDFSIKWNESESETGIIKENGLEKYCKEDLPKFKNLEDWTFSIYLKQLFEDANSVFLVLPDLSDFIENQTPLDFTKPYPQLFESDDIIYHKSEALIVKLDDMKKDGSKWNRFLSVTMSGIVLSVQYIAYQDDIDAFKHYPVAYAFQDFPVVRTGLKLDEIENGSLVYDSFLAPCLTSWNKALMRSDDLEANWVMHANPQRWRIKSDECKTCNGRGTVAVKKTNELTQCNSCLGTGTGSEGSSFNQIEISLPKTSVTSPNAPQIPFPPAGYIKRDDDAIKNLKLEVNDKIFEGFQAIGLELLSIVPTAQSGIAKQYDRKEINTFFYQVAIMVQYGYTHTAKLIYNLRYAITIDSLGGISEEKRLASLPVVTIPSDFDILTMEMLAANLSVAKKDNYDPIIVFGIERQYTEKLFGEDSDEVKLMYVVKNVDPLYGKTMDEKILAKDSGGCSAIDFTLSCQISGFANQLIEQNPDWLNKKLPDQRTDLVKMATEKQAEINKSIVPITTDVRAFA
jgi:hypothetical protein